MMQYYGNYLNWGLGGLFGMLMMVLFWGAIIYFIVWIVRRIPEREEDHGGILEKSPMDILKERYAKGEIDKKEFEEKKKDLA